MEAARKYRRYPEALKLQVAKSKNPYLFPDLEIPRTTAAYWIKERRNLPDPMSESEVVGQRIKTLERQLERERSLTRLVKRVRMVSPKGFGTVPSRPARRKIIELLAEATKLSNISDCLEIIGLSRGMYSQWLSEFFLCEHPEKFCQQRKPHQLTHHELSTMRRLVTSKQHSHVPIQSLCLWAQRNAKLFCSIDTWYKYIKIFGWIRPRSRKKVRVERVGIRAKRPNEIWHIDVTEVKTLDDTTVYIQTVYDNYSRYILAWQATSDISALNTVTLLERAKKVVQGLLNGVTPTLMSDGGPENDNHKVINFVTSSNIKRLIAGVDIHFSNSMVESLFRMLKSNFLRTEELRNVDDVIRKVGFYFTQHNEEIPRVQIGGATPKERFLNLWSESDVAKLKQGLREAQTHRKVQYKIASCQRCASLVAVADSTLSNG